MLREKLQRTLKRLGLPSGELTGPSFGVGIVNASAMAFQLLATYLLTQILGAEGYGTFAYAFSWGQLISTIGLLGIDQLLVREVSKQRSDGKGDIRSFIGWTGGRSFLVLLLFAAIGFLTSFLPLEPFTDPDTLFAFRSSMIAVPFLGAVALQRAVLHGLKVLVTGQFLEKAIRPIVLISGTAFLFFFLENFGVKQAVLINIAGIFFSFILGAFFLSSALPGRIESPQKGPSQKDLFKSASWTFLLISWVQILGAQWDILVLGGLGNMADTGILQIVLRISWLLVFFLNTLEVTLAPSLAEWHQGGDMERMQRSLTKGVRSIALLSLPLALAILLFPEALLSIFGSSFESGKTALMIFAASRGLGLLSGPTAYILMMTGHQKQALKVYGISIGVHLLLSLILIPYYGILGAAIAFAIRSLLERGSGYLEVWKQLGIDPSVLGSPRN